jgi:hypothetical protein
MIDPEIDDSKPDWNSSRTLRQFALLCLVIFSALAASEHFWHKRDGAALLFGVLAALLGLGGLIWPGGIRPVFITAIKLTMPIGWVMSRVLLGILFFVFFTPLALVFKLIGRDALRRRYEPGQQSYWEPKPSATDVKSYLRQS